MMLPRFHGSLSVMAKLSRHSRADLSLLLAAVLVWAGAVRAGDGEGGEVQSPALRSLASDAFEQGTRLDETAIVDLLSGSTLYGKYLDGRPDWAEQTAVTGQLFDVARDWLEVGQWSTYGDAVCYSYFLPTGALAPGTSCFDVYEFEDDYYFYSVGTDFLVGYTYRVDRPSLM